MEKQLRLTIELIPEPLWSINPRKMMGRSNWDKIRKEAYSQYGNQCGICKADGRLEAHEVWEYDDERLVQKLAGLIALCPMCHNVKHFGRAQILADEGNLNLEDVIDHFVSVNGCTRQDFEAHKTVTFERWKKRSSQAGWTFDWGQYQEYISGGKRPSPRVVGSQ